MPIPIPTVAPTDKPLLSLDGKFDGFCGRLLGTSPTTAILT
jgi:hypothetical protein